MSADALAKVIQNELTWLWADLDEACRAALNGIWSIQCDQLAHRIVALSRLVGVTRWESVSVALLLGGTYEKVLREAGLDVPPIDWDRVRELNEYIRRPLPERNTAESV